VLLGATGYTGDLAARALVRDGVRPVLAGRDPVRLARLADELGAQVDQHPLEHVLVDVGRADSLSGVLAAGDVLVTTVGPFTRRGRPALDAAVEAGAHYVDSTGEGPFVREVFTVAGPRAAAAGSGLLTAFGYDFVPGNLAAGLALHRAMEAGARPARVDVGYFVTGAGTGAGGTSAGTRASATGVFGSAGHAWRDGRLVDERPGARLVAVTAGGRRRRTVGVAGTEQFTLPRLAPTLREVDVGLGWFGPAAPAVSLLSRGVALLDAVPPVRDALGRAAGAVAGRVLTGSSGGPDEAARRRTGSLVVAEVRDAAGAVAARCELTGPNPYTLTGDLLSWAARAITAGGLRAAGALGPVDAFGLDELRAGCASAGLVTTTDDAPTEER
jgi:short subunit dehydrogenase-like uncharacterized protein